MKNNGLKTVIKDNNLECVLISADDYIKMIEEINDMRSLLTVIDRMNDFDGDLKDTFSQKEVEKLFNVNTYDCVGIEIE